METWSIHRPCADFTSEYHYTWCALLLCSAQVRTCGITDVWTERKSQAAPLTGRPVRLWDVEAQTLCRQSAHSGELTRFTHRLPFNPLKIALLYMTESLCYKSEFRVSSLNLIIGFLQFTWSFQPQYGPGVECQGCRNMLWKTVVFACWRLLIPFKVNAM
jgi:hypothetical protein